MLEDLTARPREVGAFDQWIKIDSYEAWAKAHKDPISCLVVIKFNCIQHLDKYNNSLHDNF